MDAGSILLTAGVVCLIAAIVGGGLKAFGIELPALASQRRQLLLALLGLAFLAGYAMQSYSAAPREDDGAGAPRPASRDVSDPADPKSGGDPAEPTSTNEADSDGPAVADAGNPDALQGTSGFIYLGMRDGDKWAVNSYAPAGRIIDSDDIPRPGDIRRLEGQVRLRSGVPATQSPLVMRADQGVVRAGTRVRIGTVTELPGGFYWAAVDILD